MRRWLFVAMLVLAPCARAADVHIDASDADKPVNLNVGDRLCVHFLDNADVKENDDKALKPGNPWVEPGDKENEGCVYFFMVRQSGPQTLRMCSTRGCCQWRLRIHNRLGR
jgi:hypothetical protein